jgi:Transglutaminase-like superfamily
LNRIRKFTLQDILKIAQLWILMAFLDIRLKLIPNRWNKRLLFSDLFSQKNMEVSDQNLLLEETVHREIRLIRIAARYHLFFNMSCLRRSLAIRTIFRKKGYPARLVYGAGSQRTAHAWVEIGVLQIDSSSNPAEYKSFHQHSAHSNKI